MEYYNVYAPPLFFNEKLLLIKEEDKLTMTEQNWFTDKSLVFEAIVTGVLDFKSRGWSMLHGIYSIKCVVTKV